MKISKTYTLITATLVLKCSYPVKIFVVYNNNTLYRGWTKICATETENARLDLINVHKGFGKHFLYNMAYYKSIYMSIWLYEWFH